MDRCACCCARCRAIPAGAQARRGDPDTGDDRHGAPEEPVGHEEAITFFKVSARTTENDARVASVPGQGSELSR